MLSKRNFMLPMTVLTFAAMISGCSTVPLQSGAEKVKVIDTRAPQGCQYKGPVESNDVNGASHSYTTHEHLQTDQLNNLKNQALALDANVIVLNHHETSYVSTYRNTSKRLDTHQMAGDAYRCNARALNQLPVSDTAKVSDLKNNAG